MACAAQGDFHRLIVVNAWYVAALVVVVGSVAWFLAQPGSCSDFIGCGDVVTPIWVPFAGVVLGAVLGFVGFVPSTK
jgi:hypothetical protein